MISNQLNVLFVMENEEDFIELRDLFETIQNWEFRLENVPDFELAWEKISSGQYDICLLAYHLDKRDGVKFLQRVIEQKIATSLVLFIDPADHDLMADPLEFGAVDYLVKGQIDAPLLKRIIRYAVKHKELLETRQTKVKSSTGQLVNGAGQESGQQDQLFFNLDVYGIEILDAQGNITDCNETYQHLLGYSRKEIIGQHTTAFATERSKKIFARKLMTLHKKGYAEGELELIRKDNTKVIVWRRYRAIFDENGQCRAIVSYNRNITERLKAVRQISLLARALEQEPVAIMITDKHGTVEYVNFNFTELTEYQYSDIVGKDVRSLETEWQSPEDIEDMWQTIKGGEEWRGEWYNLTKTGEIYWELVTAIPLFSAKGHITHFIFVKENFSEQKQFETDSLQSQRRMGDLMTEQIDDLMTSNEALRFEVSERKRVEQELRQSRARLRAQFKGIPVPTYTWEQIDNDYLLIDYNDAADTDSQGTVASLVGQSARAVFGDRPEVLEDFDRCAAEKSIVKREGPYQLVTTGESKYYVTTYNFVPPNLVVVYIEDTTKYKQMEADLEHYRRQLAAPGDSDELEKAKEALRYEITKREQIEQQARENEERLKHIAASIDERLREHYRTIPIPTYTWQMIGGEFVLIDFNDAAAKAMGRIVDFFGKTASQIFTDRPQVLADFQRCYDEKSLVVRRAPYQLVTTGETRFFVTTYNYLHPNLIIVHIQDITEQKQTEDELTRTKDVLAQEQAKRGELEAALASATAELDQLKEELEAQRRVEDSLRQSRARLKVQYKSIPVPTYSWQRAGHDFVLVDFNDAAEKANHGRIADLMGKPASEVFKDRPQVLDDFERCYDEKGTVQREASYRLLSRDEIRHFITTYTFVPPNLILVYIQDITEYKQGRSAVN